MALLPPRRETTFKQGILLNYANAVNDPSWGPAMVLALLYF